MGRIAPVDSVAQPDAGPFESTPGNVYNVDKQCLQRTPILLSQFSCLQLITKLPFT